MARIRSIHPGLFSDPEFASLSDAAAIFYLGLLTEADDNGIFDWNPAKLRIRLRPGKDGGVEALLSELEASDKIRSYEINGRKYGAIRNFRKFQRPKSPKSWFVIPSDFRNYVGLSDGATEIPPQMEEGGGRREEITDPIGSGADAPQPDDPVKALFDAGVKLMTENGATESNARSVIGKFRKAHGDDAVMGAIAEARRLQITEPIAWMTQRFAGTQKPRESWNQRRIREGQELLRQ